VENTQPWYKQFWLWFILFLPACAVVASITTVVIAFKNDDSLVKDNYYKAGKAINQDLSQQEEASRLGLTATVTIDPLVGELLLVLDGNLDTAAQPLQLDIIHPLDAERDISLNLNHRQGFSYVAQLPNSVSGRRYIQLSGSKPSPWQLKGEIQLQLDEQEQLHFKLPE
jgi:hypothetical protein